MMNLLRFKDEHGQDFPEWELRELGLIASKVIIKNRDVSVKHVLTNSATQGIVNQSDYFDRDIANKNNLDGYYVVELDDFVYNPRISATAPVGPIKRNKAAIGVMSPLYTVFRFSAGNLDFLEQYFETTRWHDHLKSVANSGARHDRMNVTNSDFLSLPLVLPHEQEQTKIANILMAVDEKITQLTQKCELLARYKKGLMQQIFSQALSFKENNGQDFPEWETLQLCDIATRVTRKNKENNLNVLTISAQQGLINQEEYFHKSVSAKDVTNYYLLHNGDFAYNKSYSKGYPMGAIKCLNRYSKGVVSTLYICFKFNDGNINAFFEHYFEAGLQNVEIEKVAQEGARNHGLLNIGLNDFFGISLTIPSTGEQRKIASFLNAIDDKITHTHNQLQAMKQYKQGLLQKMFI